MFHFNIKCFFYSGHHPKRNNFRQILTTKQIDFFLEIYKWNFVDRIDRKSGDSTLNSSMEACNCYLLKVY